PKGTAIRRPLAEAVILDSEEWTSSFGIKFENTHGPTNPDGYFTAGKLVAVTSSLVEESAGFDFRLLNAWSPNGVPIYGLKIVGDKLLLPPWFFPAVDPRIYISVRVTDEWGRISTYQFPVTIDLNEGNDAPYFVENTSQPMALHQRYFLTEDPESDQGILISSMLVRDEWDIVDVDDNSRKGIAITHVDTEHGRWEFSTDNGLHWLSMGPVHDVYSRLLAADSMTRIRFVPDENFNGNIGENSPYGAISYRAWDQTDGINGGVRNTTINGGSSAYSTGLRIANFKVYPVNDSPTLLPEITLDSIYEDIPDSLNPKIGRDVILSLASPYDVEGGLLDAISIIDADSTNGHWEIYGPSGFLWGNFGEIAVMPTDITSIRFIPDADFHGTASFQFVVHDVDGAQSNICTATIEVTSVNDPPSAAGSLTLTGIEEDAGTDPGTNPGDLVSDLLTQLVISDVDVPSYVQGIRFKTPGTAPGVWQYLPAGGSWTDLAAEDLASVSDRIRFVPGLNYNGTASFTFTVVDDEDGESPDSLSAFLDITPVNDAPELLSGSQVTLTTYQEEDLDNPGTSVDTIINALTGSGALTDIDPTTLGIAVIATNVIHGSWEFSEDGGTTWNPLTINAANPVQTLSADGLTRIRFLPNVNFAGLISSALTFRAWEENVGGPELFSANTGSASISVSDINDNPTDILLSNDFVIENDPGAIVGNLSTVDPDTNDTFTYSIVSGGDGAQFAIVGNQLRVGSAGLDYEAGTTRTVTIRTQDHANLETTVTFTIQVGDTNDAPTDLTLTGSTVAENTAAGITVGTFSVSDQDLGDTHTFELIDSGTYGDNLLFEIVGNQLRVVGPTDFESLTTPHELQIRVRSSDGIDYTDQTFAIVVTDVNESPDDFTLSNSAVDEAVVDTIVGIFATIDPDAGDAFTYSLVTGTGDDDNSYFTIVGNTLKTLQPLDADTRTSYSVRVRTTDQGNLSIERQFTIIPIQQNEAPTDVLISNAFVNENTPDAAIGTLSSLDPDAGNTFTYQILDASSPFVLENDLLKVGLTGLDFESGATRTVTIRSTDQDGLYRDVLLTIQVGDLNDAPEDITLSNTNLPENQPSGNLSVVVGDLSTVDQDVGDTHTYELFDSDGSGNYSKFTIINNQLFTNAFFDFETIPSPKKFSIGVRSSDGELSYDKTLIITIVNVPEAPDDIELDDNSVPENGLNYTVGTLYATDPDFENIDSFSLTSGPGGNDNDKFHIVGNNLRTSEAFDFEIRSTYSILVRATDSTGLFFDKQFTITVTDQNDAPTDIVLTNSSVIENAANEIVGTLQTVDQDAGSTFTYSFAAGGADNGRFQIDSNTNNLLVGSEPLDFESQSSYSIKVRSTDNHGSWVEVAFVITAVDLPDPPIISGSATMTPIDEDLDLSSNTGDLVSTLMQSFTFTDQDGTVSLPIFFDFGTGSGTWQFKTPAGTWLDLPADQAMDGADLVRFVPDLDFNGSADLTFYIKDNEGVPSVTRGIISIAVLPTNDAPVLNADGDPALPSILEGNPVVPPAQPVIDAGNTGISIPALIASMGPAGGISDVDASPLTGIAIIDLNSLYGFWQVSTNAGIDWSPIASISDSQALLLTSDSNNLIRFVPTSDYFGTISDAVTFRAWDQTSGANGDLVDLSGPTSTGGMTAFSSDSETASLIVTSVNDIPTLVSLTAELPSIAEDTPSASILGVQISDILTQLGANDVEDGTNLKFLIQSLSGSGTWEWRQDSVTLWQVINPAQFPNDITSDDWIRFVPQENFFGSSGITFKLADINGGISPEASAHLEVTPVEDPSVIKASSMFLRTDLNVGDQALSFFMSDPDEPAGVSDTFTFALYDVPGQSTQNSWFAISGINHLVTTAEYALQTHVDGHIVSILVQATNNRTSEIFTAKFELTERDATPIILVGLSPHADDYSNGGILDFGVLPQNSTATRTIYVTNDGDLALDIPQLAVLAPDLTTVSTQYSYEVLDAANFTDEQGHFIVDPGETLAIRITPNTTDVGSLHSILRITSGAGNTPQFDLHLLTNVVSPDVIQTIDATTPQGSSQTSGWGDLDNSKFDPYGYRGVNGSALQYRSSPSPSVTLDSYTWNFNNVSEGLYRVYTTWPTPDRTGSYFFEAPYTIYDGPTPASTTIVNQRMQPMDLVDENGIAWEDLGLVSISANNDLKVELHAPNASLAPDASRTVLVADAVRIVRIDSRKLRNDAFTLPSGRSEYSLDVAGNDGMTGWKVVPVGTVDPSIGSVTVDLQTNNLVFRPAAGKIGKDVNLSLKYYLEKNGEQTDVANVVLRLNDVEPIANDDSFVTSHSQSLVIDPLYNDLDPQGDRLIPKITGIVDGKLLSVQGGVSLELPDNHFNILIDTSEVPETIIGIPNPEKQANWKLKIQLNGLTFEKIYPSDVNPQTIFNDLNSPVGALFGEFTDLEVSRPRADIDKYDVVALRISFKSDHAATITVEPNPGTASNPNPVTSVKAVTSRGIIRTNSDGTLTFEPNRDFYQIDGDYQVAVEYQAAELNGKNHSERGLINLAVRNSAPFLSGQTNVGLAYGSPSDNYDVAFPLDTYDRDGDRLYVFTHSKPYTS
ncbi:MAG: cadherin domain-containing protein, partial [Planctomycetaceae bacterium]|nr:cadherin domain-containing protein [Planctomycetaceae bacterium]